MCKARIAIRNPRAGDRHAVKLQCFKIWTQLLLAATFTSPTDLLLQVCGRHADGQPLPLSMQAVVRESAPNRTYVVLKPRQPHMGSREALLASVQAQRHMMMEDQQAAPGTDGPWPGLDAQAMEGGGDAVHAGVREQPPPSVHVAEGPKARTSGQVRNAASLRRSLDSNHSWAAAPLRQLSSVDMDGAGEPGKVKAAVGLAPIELSPVFGEQAQGMALGHPPPANDIQVSGSGYVTPPFILSTDNSDPKSSLWATYHGEVSQMQLPLRGLPGNDARPADVAASQPHPFAVADRGAPMQLGGRTLGSSPSPGMIRALNGEGVREGSGSGMRNALSPRVGRPGGGQHGGIGSSTGKVLAVPPPAVVDKLGDMWDGKGLLKDVTELSGGSSESEGRRRSSGGAPKESSDDSDGNGRGRGSQRPLRPQSSASRRGGTANDSAAGSKGRRASAPGLVKGSGRHSSGSLGGQDSATPSMRRASSRESQPRSRRSSVVRRLQDCDPAAGGGDAGGGGGNGGGYDAAAFAAGVERLSQGQEAAERDDDGGSDTSGVSGVSEGMDAGLPQADYRRGKRYRKLLKVLSSPSVQRAATDFQWQALLANVTQLLTNLVAFVLLTVLLHREVRAHVAAAWATTTVLLVLLVLDQWLVRSCCRLPCMLVFSHAFKNILCALPCANTCRLGTWIRLPTADRPFAVPTRCSSGCRWALLSALPLYFGAAIGDMLVVGTGNQYSGNTCNQFIYHPIFVMVAMTARGRHAASLYRCV